MFPLVYIVRKFEKEKEDKTMKKYFNGKDCAVSHGLLLLIGPSFNENERESIIFYSQNAMNHYLMENGFKLVK